MSNSEERHLLQQITFLTRLIKRHKTAAKPEPKAALSNAYRLVRNAGPNATAQASCSYSNSYSASSQAASTSTSIKQKQKSLSYPVIPIGVQNESPSYSRNQSSAPVGLPKASLSSSSTTSCPINSKPKTILINPNFNKTDEMKSVTINSRSSNVSNPCLQSSFSTLIKPKVVDSIRPKTILVNPNFKGETKKTSVHINSKVFNFQEKKKQENHKNSLLVSSVNTASVENVASTADYTIKSPSVKKYSFKSNRKLVCQAVSPKPSTSQIKSILPDNSTNPLISINNRKLVRMSSKPENIITALKFNNSQYKKSRNIFYKYKKPILIFKKTNSVAAKVLAKQKRSPRASSSKYKFVRGSKTKPTTNTKFCLDRRPPGPQSRIKNVKKYSVKYEQRLSTPRRYSWQTATLPAKTRTPLLNKSFRYRKTSTSSQGSKLSEFTIRGEKFVIDPQGKTLKRLGANTNVARKQLSLETLKRIHVAGVTYAARAPNVYVRTNDHKARTLVSQAKYKSISVLVNKLRKNNQPCIFYRRFGKCIRQEKGTCPCVHDAKQVAICKKFLQGKCEVAGCLLSHDVGPEKMPTCQYFLDGCCVRDPCPYLHVKVNAHAEICQDFLIGYCASGNMCKKRHINVCPEFERSGKCSKGKFCPYPHKASQKRPHPSKPAKVLAEPQSEKGEVAESGRYYQSEGPGTSGQLSPEPPVSESRSSESVCPDTITPGSRKKPRIGLLPSYIPI